MMNIYGDPIAKTVAWHSSEVGSAPTKEAIEYLLKRSKTKGYKADFILFDDESSITKYLPFDTKVPWETVQYKDRAYSVLHTAIKAINTKDFKQFLNKDEQTYSKDSQLTWDRLSEAEQTGQLELSNRMYNYDLTQMILNDRKAELRWTLKEAMYDTRNCTGISQYNLALLKLAGY